MADEDLSPDALRTLLQAFVAQHGPDLGAHYHLDLDASTLDGAPETVGAGLLRLGPWLIETKEHGRTAIYSMEVAPGEDTTLLLHLAHTPEGWTISDWYVEEAF